MDNLIEKTFSSHIKRFPLTLIDIGASRGIKRTWKKFKNLRVIGFEPDKRAFYSLVKYNRPNTIYLNTGLYNQKKQVNFYLTRKPEVSSLLRPNRELLENFPNPERFDIIKTLKIQVDTLDNQIIKNNIKDIDFIKIDTQGSELFILQGSKKLLEGDVFGLDLEVEFIKLYQNQPLFSDIDEFLRQFGFELFDLRQTYWKRQIGKKLGNKKGQIIGGDALYLRSIESFKKILQKIKDKEQKKTKILKTLSISLLYGYLDYALGLLYNTKEYFNQKEFSYLSKNLKRNIKFSNKLPDFKGRGRIANFFYTLHKEILPNYNGTYNVGKDIGNNE